MLPTETLTLWLTLLGPAFFDCIGLAALGGAAISCLALIRSLTGGGVFPRLFARQQAWMAVIGLLLSTAAFGATIPLAQGKLPWLADWATTPGAPGPAILAAFGAALILVLIHALLFKPLQRRTALSLITGLPAAAVSLYATSMAAVMVPGLFSALATLDPTPAMAWPAVPAWPLAVLFPLLAVSFAGAFGLIWLMLRRNRDDFGRDYYKTAFPMAARWAIAGMLPALGALAWFVATLPAELQQLALAGSACFSLYASIGTSLMAIVLWVIIARSKTPLQLKGLGVLAALLSWAAYTSFTTFLAELTPLL